MSHAGEPGTPTRTQDEAGVPDSMGAPQLN